MNNILQPLRFYSSLSEATAKRQEAIGYKVITPLIAIRTQLIPFLLTCTLGDTSQNPITTCEVINYKTGVVRDILSNMSFKFGVDNISLPYKEYIFYDGLSTIAALGQGVYYLHIKNLFSGTTYNEWYSGLFKVGFYTKVCTFQFRNSVSFGDMWMPPKAGLVKRYYKATYESYTFDQGEFDEYIEAYKNDDNYDVETYQRVDKLRTVAILGDSDVLDSLKVMKMCDDIYFTDEISKSAFIKIVDVVPEPFGQSNYLTIMVKYRVIDNSVISVNETPVEDFFNQNGTAYSAPDTRITFDGEDIKFNNEKIKFG